MENSDYNEQFIFDEMDRLKCQSMIKIIGVGKFGNDVVESINRTELHDIDFITINQGENTRPFDTVPQQDNVRSIAKYNLDKNDPTMGDKLHDIMGDLITLIFVVSSMDEDCSSIVSALCHCVHTYENDDENQVALALLRVPSGYNMSNKTQEDIDRIAKEATKVMIFDDAKDTALSPYPTSNDEKQRIIDVIRTVCKVFIDYDYCCVDYNDVATVLQSGIKVVYGTGEGTGDNREGKAVMGLKHHIESNGYKMEDVKDMLLLLNFSPLHEITYEKLNIMTDLLYKFSGKNVEVLWNATNDVPDDSDTLVINAIAIL